MSKVYDFRLLNQNELEFINIQIDQQINIWRKDWFVENVSFSFTKTQDLVPNDIKRQWLKLGDGGDTWIAVELSDMPWRGLSGLLLNSPLPSGTEKLTPLLEHLISDCLYDLLQKIAQLVGISFMDFVSDKGTLDGLIADPRSGCLVGLLHGKSIKQRLFLSGKAIQHMLSTNTEFAEKSRLHNGMQLDSRETAIQAQTIDLEVMLGETELTVRELATISVGDVIRLNTSYKEALTVRTLQGTPVVKTYLGLRDERKAIEITEKYE